MKVWRDICTDIREGTVHERVSDPELRSSVQEILSPNPDLADFIERECAKGWPGIIERLFPNLQYIMSIYSGSMFPYIAPTRNYAGSVPLMNGDYGSSESWIAVNLDPRAPTESASYTIIPDFAYFEFIPVNRDSTGFEFVEDNEIAGLADVKLGQEYEIVLTTVAGMISISWLNFFRRRTKLVTLRQPKADFIFDRGTEAIYSGIQVRGIIYLHCSHKTLKIVSFNERVHGGRQIVDHNMSLSLQIK